MCENFKKMRLFLKLVFVCVMLTPLTGFSQRESNWTFDIGLTQTYPGFFNLYNGSVDAAAGYNMKLTHGLFAGASFGIQFLKLNGTQSKTVVYKPKIIIHYRFGIGKNFNIVPWVSAGYSFLNIKNREYNYAETQQGFNLSPELKLLWNTKTRVDVYIYGRYDYIKLNEDADFTRLNYYRDVHLTSFGIGVLIKKKKHEVPEKR